MLFTCATEMPGRNPHLTAHSPKKKKQRRKEKLRKRNDESVFNKVFTCGGSCSRSTHLLHIGRTRKNTSRTHTLSLHELPREKSQVTSVMRRRKSTRTSGSPKGRSHSYCAAELIDCSRFCFELHHSEAVTKCRNRHRCKTTHIVPEQKEKWFSE